jgi:flavodoxin
MKILVVFYSRSGNTKKIAESISESLDCDIEEIVDTEKRGGIFGYIKSGYEAFRGKLSKIEDPKNDVSQYDLVIIGTPVWAGKMAVPVRTYITQNHAKFGKTAFFSTAGGTNFDSTFSDMKEVSGASPIAEIGIRAKEVQDGSYKPKVAEFLTKIQPSDK